MAAAVCVVVGCVPTYTMARFVVRDRFAASSLESLRPTASAKIVALNALRGAEVINDRNLVLRPDARLTPALDALLTWLQALCAARQVDPPPPLRCSHDPKKGTARAPPPAFDAGGNAVWDACVFATVVVAGGTAPCQKAWWRTAERLAATTAMQDVSCADMRRLADTRPVPAAALPMAVALAVAFDLAPTWGVYSNLASVDALQELKRRAGPASPAAGQAALAVVQAAAPLVATAASFPLWALLQWLQQVCGVAVAVAA